MRKLIFTLIGLIFMINPAFNQESDTDTHIKGRREYATHYLGINGGFTTGLGFAYRYFPANYGCQITLLPLYDKNNTYISFGLTYLREIKQFKESRFLFYVSNHLTNFPNEDNTYVNNLGLGIGFDYDYYDFIFNFMIGYAGIDIFDELMTRPTVEMGIFYNF